MLSDKEMRIAKQKYKIHIFNCEGKNRVDKLGNPIKMLLTFDEWLDIWLSSGHWHERGNKRGQYVMSRYNDIGHYEIGNVEIKTGTDNQIENKSSNQWKSSHLSGMKKMHNDPTYKQNQKKMKADPAFQAKRISAVIKANNKPISCDGVIYPSIKDALVVAPAHITDKRDWLYKQVRKNPTRYFHV